LIDVRRKRGGCQWGDGFSGRAGGWLIVVVQGFLVGVHSWAKYITDSSLLKRVGLKSSNLLGKDGTRRGMVNDLLLAGKTPPIRFADSPSKKLEFSMEPASSEGLSA
jgi:hypothetical protein